ncbi:MAG TPA: hypothetical protein VGN43_05330 [Steroidobacteraceae bacterium]|nr:hypothetical protein [Steroidobacteraceae bacterium]
MVNNAVFADSVYFLALTIERDTLHGQAVAIEATYQGRIVTTQWVLTEVADGLAPPSLRSRFTRLCESLGARKNVHILPVHHLQYQMGCRLYERRVDKAWSLTDCMSFLAMRAYGLQAALTADQHFVQAGFRILMGRDFTGVSEPAPAYGDMRIYPDWEETLVRDAA